MSSGSSTEVPELDLTSFKKPGVLHFTSAKKRQVQQNFGKHVPKSYVEAHVTRVQAEIEKTTKRLELEKHKLHVLGETSRKAQTEYDDRRWKFYCDSSTPVTRNSLRLLENKVEFTSGKLNRNMDEINKIRQHVNKQRKERINLDIVFRQLKKELLRDSERLQVLTESVSSLQDFQQESATKLKQLRNIKDQERDDFKKVATKIQEEIKIQDRLMREIHIKSQKENTSNKNATIMSSYTVTEKDRGFDYSTLMKCIFKISMLNVIQRYNIKQQRKKVMLLEKAMDNIKLSTGIADTDKIVSIFSQLEKRNYSIMSYVYTVYHELEEISTKTRLINDQLKHRQLHDAHANSITSEVLKRIDKQIEETKYATDAEICIIKCQTNFMKRGYKLLKECVEIVRNCWKSNTMTDFVNDEDENQDTTLLLMLWFLEEFVHANKKILLKEKKCVQTTKYAEQIRLFDMDKRHEAFGDRNQGNSHIHKPRDGNNATTSCLKSQDIPSSLSQESDSEEETVHNCPIRSIDIRERVMQQIYKKRKKQDCSISGLHAFNSFDNNLFEIQSDYGKTIVSVKSEQEDQPDGVRSNAGSTHSALEKKLKLVLKNPS